MSAADKVRDAMTAMSALKQRDLEFKAEIARRSASGQAGWLRWDGHALTGSCLGIPLSSVSRCVVESGAVVAMEYLFIANDALNTRVLAARAYLDKSGRLRIGKPSGVLVCDVDDDDMIAKLTDAIAAEMLESKVFSLSLD